MTSDKTSDRFIVDLTDVLTKKVENLTKEVEFLKQIYNELTKKCDNLSSDVRDLRNESVRYRKQTITKDECEHICSMIGSLATELSSYYGDKSKDEYFDDIWEIVKKRLVRARLIKNVYAKYNHFTVEQYIKALEIVEDIKMEYKKKKVMNRSSREDYAI